MPALNGTFNPLSAVVLMHSWCQADEPLNNDEPILLIELPGSQAPLSTPLRAPFPELTVGKDSTALETVARQFARGELPTVIT